MTTTLPSLAWVVTCWYTPCHTWSCITNSLIHAPMTFSHHTHTNSLIQADTTSHHTYTILYQVIVSQTHSFKHLRPSPTTLTQYIIVSQTHSFKHVQPSPTTLTQLFLTKLLYHKLTHSSTYDLLPHALMPFPFNPLLLPIDTWN